MGSLFVVLLVATQFPPFVDERKIEEKDGIQRGIITTIPHKDVGKGKTRKFHLSFESSMEQLDKSGDLVTEGATVPGKTTHAVHGRFDFSNDEPFFWPHKLGGVDICDRDRRYIGSDWCEIKVTSVRNNLIGLQVSWKQTRNELNEAGTSSSWNLTLEATKIVKLGEKFKLEFGDEKTIGTKCTFEGLISEIGQGELKTLGTPSDVPPAKK